MTIFQTKKDLKTSIVLLLGESFPLQVHDIRERFKQTNQKTFSPQAIHLALKELIRLEIVLKKDRAYQLNPAYIEKLNTWSRTLTYNYFLKKSGKFDVPRGSKKKFEANSLLEVDILWNRIIEEKMTEFPEKTEVYLQHMQHAWFYLGEMGEEVRIVSLIQNHFTSFCTLVDGNTPLDKWIGRLYTGNAMFYAHNQTPQPGHRYPYAVLGHYVIEVTYPKTTARNIEQLFSRTDTLGKLRLADIIALVNTPTDATITLHNNSKKASRLREKILHSFKIVRGK